MAAASSIGAATGAGAAAGSATGAATAKALRPRSVMRAKCILCWLIEARVYCRIEAKLLEVDEVEVVDFEMMQIV